MKTIPIVVVVALFLALAVPARAGDKCALCRDAGTLVCAACSGKKVRTVACPECEGRGDLLCPYCCGEYDTAGGDKPIKKGKGILPCPNEACYEGKVTYEIGTAKDTCRLCSGRSSIDCLFCRKTSFPCVTCAGRKKVDSACGECRATGAIPCPLCRVQPERDSCAACGGAEPESCPRCASSGATLALCYACGGNDEAACRECWGLGRYACRQCNGTGVTRSKSTNRTTGNVTIAGKKSHDSCSGKGSFDCKVCRGKKKTACWVKEWNPKLYHKEGRLKIDCAYCAGAGRLECAGCRKGSHRGFEAAALRLREAGLQAQAKALLEEAARRAERWFSTPRTADESAEDTVARVREREATLARLRKAANE